MAQVARVRVIAGVFCLALTLQAVAPAAAAAAPATCATIAPPGGLHAGDKLRVTVFDHADLSVDTTVTNAGQIVVPLVGSVDAAGRLPQAVAQTIARGLRAYLVSPSVDISVLEENTTAYYGGVASGPVVLRPGETLVMAAADPKIPATADLSQVTLIRQGRTIGTCDVVALRASGNPGPLLQANDVISFASNPIAVTVSGAVDAPVTAYLGTTEPLGDAFGLVKLSKDANLQRIAIVQGSTTVIAGRESPVFAQPGQTGWSIVIPHASQVTVLGLVGKAGTVTLPGDQSLLSAITAAGGVSKGGDLARVVVMVPSGPGSYSSTIYDVTKFGRGNIVTNPPQNSNPTLADGDVVYIPEQPKTPVFLNPKTLLLTALYVAKVYLKLEIPPKP